MTLAVFQAISWTKMGRISAFSWKKMGDATSSRIPLKMEKDFFMDKNGTYFYLFMEENGI